LFKNIPAFFIFSVKLSIKEIAEKEDLQDYEDNEQFDQDNYPDPFPPPGQTSETFII